MSEPGPKEHNDLSAPLLQIRNLKVGFPDPDIEGASSDVLRGVNLDIAPGQAIALIGNSGCGKSMTALAVCGLLPAAARWSGSIIWRGKSLDDPAGAKWRAVRGSGIGLVLQEPTQCLNPVITVGNQIAESLMVHKGLSQQEAWGAAVNLLKEVQVPEPHLRATWYPHQLSGGMCQRVLVAAALACGPDLLIADEPTTSLDPTVQRDILFLLRKIISDRGMALLFITHNHDLIPVMANQVATMQEGRITSLGDAGTFSAAGMSSMDERPLRGGSSSTEPALEIKNISITFNGKAKQPVKAVQAVSLVLTKGQAIGVAGESGCGKTTLARILSGHLQPDGGQVLLSGGVDFYNLKGFDLRQARRKVQLVFQNAAGSLNPRQRVGSALSEAAAGKGGDVGMALAEVGLPAALQFRFPHELSGGQRQRVALARALSCNPDVLVADEPTTALDPDSQIQVLDLLTEIMESRDLALLLVSHDLKVLHRVCSKVAVMYGGYVVEVYSPLGGDGIRHPYGQELWNSQPGLWAIESEGVFGRRNKGKSSPAILSGGCPYAHKCQLHKSRCDSTLPKLKKVEGGDFLRCPEVGS